MNAWAPTVTVAIPTRNRPDRVERTIRSVLAGSRLPDQLLVVDQSGDRRTEEAIHRLRTVSGGRCLVHVASSRRGASANRNDAIRSADGEFLAFCDDDVEVDRRWLERMVAEWESVWRRGPVVITGRILPGPEYDPDAPVPGVRDGEKRIVFRRRPGGGDVLFGGHFGASRTVFERLGEAPFDERLGPGSPFRGGEDEDFAYRVLALGVPVVYEPTIAITHHPAPDGWSRMAFAHAYGGGALFAKHALSGERGMLVGFARSLGVNAVKAGKAFLRLRGREGAVRAAAALGMSAGFAAWMARRPTAEAHRESGSG